MKIQLMLASVFFFTSLSLADEIEKGLSNYFGSLPKIKVSQIGPVYVVDGTVDQIADLARVNEIAGSLREKGVSVKSFVELSKPGKELLASFIEGQIGSPEISVRFVSDKVFLEGIASNDFEADRAVEIAKASIFTSIVRRPAQDSPNISTIVDMLKVRPPAPAIVNKSKKLSKAP